MGLQNEWWIMKQVSVRSHISQSILESYEVMQMAIIIYMKSNISKFLNKTLALKSLKSGE